MKLAKTWAWLVVTGCLWLNACIGVAPPMSGQATPEAPQTVMSTQTETGMMGKRFSSDTPDAAMKEIAALQDLVGLYSGTGGVQVFTRPFSETVFEILLQGLSSTHPQTQKAALDLLTIAIQQGYVSPAAITARILSTTEALRNTHGQGTADELSAAVAASAEKVLWHARVQGLSGQARTAFLAENLNNTSDGSYYYSFQAMNYLAELADAEARQALQAALKSAKERGAGQNLVDQLEANLAKITVLESLRGLAGKQQVERLVAELRLSWQDEARAIWLLQRLAQLTAPSVDPTLRAIRDDERYSFGTRYVAQEFMVGRGVLAANERTLHLLGD